GRRCGSVAGLELGQQRKADFGLGRESPLGHAALFADTRDTNPDRFVFLHVADGTETEPMRLVDLKFIEISLLIMASAEGCKYAEALARMSTVSTCTHSS